MACSPLAETAGQDSHESNGCEVGLGRSCDIIVAQKAVMSMLLLRFMADLVPEEHKSHRHANACMLVHAYLHTIIQIQEACSSLIAVIDLVKCTLARIRTPR